MIRPININPCLNGYVVQIGCQIAVFTDSTSLAAAIGEYYADPEATEKKYLENSVNKYATGPAQAIPREREIYQNLACQAAATPQATHLAGTAGVF